MENDNLPIKKPPKTFQEIQLPDAKGKRCCTLSGPWGLSAVLFVPLQSGKFAGASADGQDAPGQGLDYAEDVAEHEQMTAVLRNSLQLGDTTPSVLPGLRTRTRASRGAHKATFNLLHVHAPAIEQMNDLGSHVLNKTALSVFT